VLYGGVHIKEASATRMEDVQDQVSYIGLKDAGTHLQLYKCMTNYKAFEDALNAKLNRTKTAKHDNISNNKKELRTYLSTKVAALAQYLDFILVTDFDKDHLLTVPLQDVFFVYFGAMTKNLVHVACWLRLQKTNGKVDYAKPPKIFFWVLHTSYAQELEELSTLESKPINNVPGGGDDVSKELDLQEGIETTQSV
jgi:hypothetical protein